MAANHNVPLRKSASLVGSCETRTGASLQHDGTSNMVQCSYGLATSSCLLWRRLIGGGGGLHR